MSYRKGKTKFRKAFRHLKKVSVDTDSLVKMYALKGMCKALVKMCKDAHQGVGGGVVGDGQGGSPGPGGNAGTGIMPPNAAPDTPFALSAGGYGTGQTVSPDAVVTGYMGMSSADLGTIRQASKRFDQAFKHVSQYYVHDVVRQQATQCSRDAQDLMLGLYGGETTAPEPRI